ncbi:MAG: ATP-binding protein [Ginsengibacter sp.]
MIKTRLQYLYGIFRRVNHFLWSDHSLSRRKWYIKYGFSILLLFFVTTFKLFYFEIIGVETPFLLFFAIVILATGFGGIGPGIFTTIASALLCNYYFLPPVNKLHFSNGEISQFIIYIFECLLIISLSGALTRANKNLRRSEERFRAMIENSSDAIVVADGKGLILYASPAIEKVLGYTAKELKRINALRYIHKDEKEKLKNMFSSLLQAPGKSQIVTHRYLHKDKSWAWIESTITNLLHHPAVDGIVANFRNVTDRVILEKQKDDFVGIATHELKTPVTSLKAYAQILFKRFIREGNESSATLVKKMEAQLNKLIGLIGDMLDVTKIEGGIMQFQESFYDFNELVNEVAEELQRTTGNHKIELKLDDSAKVFGDRERIAQVLTNLISNAIKYSPHSTIITIFSKHGRYSITLCVEDKGIGISRENQDKIFERFYRVSGSDSYTFPGIGLGLYISQEIVKRQGGRIWVESEKGEGAVFCIELPYNHKVNQTI